MGTVNPGFTSKGAGLGEPQNINVGDNTGYTATITSANGPHTELVRDSDALASGSTIGSHDFYAGSSTKTKVASIDVVVSGTSEDSADMVLRVANSGTLSNAITIDSTGSVAVPTLDIDSLTVDTITATTLNATTAAITTGNITTANVGTVAATTVTSSGGYVNLTSTAGATGVGVRLNSGTVEFKNTAGAWQAVAAATTTAGGWTDAGAYVYLTTGTDDVIMGAVATPSAKLELVDSASQLKLTNSSTSLGVVFNTDAYGNTTLDSDGVFTLPLETSIAGAALSNDVYRTTWPSSSADLIQRIAKSTAITGIVDAAVMSSADDADASWRKNHSASWWSEAFSATRGGTKDAPPLMYAVANTATTGTVTIIDAATGAVWMKIDGDVNTNHLRDYNITSVAYTNGVLVIGGPSAALCIMDFVRDRSVTCWASSVRWAIGGIGSRNAGLGHIVDSNSTLKIVSDTVRSVAARTINGHVYIVAGTDGGVSVMDYTAGVVYDSAVTSSISAIGIDTSGYITFRSGNTTYRSSSSIQTIIADGWTSTTLSGPAAGTVTKIASIPVASVADSTNAVIAVANQTTGLELLHLDSTSAATPWLARHTTTYRHPALPSTAYVWPLHDDPSVGVTTDASGNGLTLTAYSMESGDKTALVAGSDLSRWTIDGSAEYAEQATLHDQTNSGASWYGAGTVWSNGSATFGITDTDTDLQALYQTLAGNSGYVIVAGDDASPAKYAHGYIRAVALSGSDQTLTVNNSAAGGTQNWIKQSGFNESAATFTWRIFNAKSYNTGAFTYLMLIKGTSVDRGLANRVDSTGTYPWSWGLYVNSSGYLQATVYNSGAKTATGSNSVVDNNWHLVGIRFNPGVQVAALLDGNVAATNTTSIPASLADSAWPLQIGCYHSATAGRINYWNAAIGMPILIPAAISDGQFKRLWEAIKPSLIDNSVGNLTASNVVKSVAWDRVTRSLIVGQDSGATGTAQVFKVDGWVYTDEVNTSDSDDAGSAVTSARTVAVAAGSGLMVAGTTAEAFAKGIDDESPAFGERVKSVSSATTLSSGITKLLVTTGSTNVTIGLPAVANNRNRVAEVWKVDSGVGVVVIDGNASETINGLATVSLSTQWSYKNLTGYASGWIAK